MKAMKSSRCGLLIAGTILLIAVSCSRREPPAENNAADRASRKQDATFGKWVMDEYVGFQFAIYYLPKPAKDPLVELESLLDGSFKSVEKVDELPTKPMSRMLSAWLRKDVQEAYIPPDKELLRFSGKGMSADEADALQTSSEALVLNFAHPKSEVWTGLRDACALVYSLAEKTGGLIWDEETRQVFGRSAWKEARIDQSTDAAPDISRHITIHAYQGDNNVRAITLGMSKFGLPDVVIDNFSWSHGRNVGHLINVFAQTMAEGAVVPDSGAFDLDIHAIKNAEVRDLHMSSLEKNATGKAALSLSVGKWEEGDPVNRLIEIKFDRAPGPDDHAKRDHVLARFFGWEDAVTGTKHTEEIEAASRRARAKLPALRDDFNRGLAPGEFVQVKAPFATPDGGREWMWVEVIKWDKDKISGLLKNEPFNIPGLHAGQIVEVSESDIFDYIRNHADGTSEGNETGALIQKQTQKAEGRAE
jgi:uncharacterized protein YegJ (DUF2314 family)